MQNNATLLTKLYFGKLLFKNCNLSLYVMRLFEFF